MKTFSLMEALHSINMKEDYATNIYELRYMEAVIGIYNMLNRYIMGYE